ncbi:hypothetical protein ACWGS9_30185 [Bradyrhizobium sp. Arg314]
MIETISVGLCSAELIRLPGGDETRLMIYYQKLEGCIGRHGLGPS